MWGSCRLSKHSCRGEHCSPVPVFLARNCPEKCVAAVSWRATNGRPYTRNRARMQFFDSLNPKYFGQPHSSLPHRLRAEPPRRGGQGETVGAAIGRPPALRQPLPSRVDDEHRPLRRRGGFHIRPEGLPLPQASAGDHWSPLQNKKLTLHIHAG